jgi:glutamate synthase domain-containing protein 1
LLDSAWTLSDQYARWWWGGAHPFALLDYSIVHNGRISSYDANRRFIEMFGYQCDLLTDTEVITYMIDYLTADRESALRTSHSILAAPFWSEIEQMPEPEQKNSPISGMFSPAMLITGPFSILLGFERRANGPKRPAQAPHYGCCRKRRHRIRCQRRMRHPCHLPGC